MADRPILFSGPMVRALLAGTKTQTRRILNPQPEQFAVDDEGTLCQVGALLVEGDALPRVTLGNVITIQKLRYAVGDRLYVREHWRCGGSNDHLAPRDLPLEWAHPIEYYADLTDIRNGRFRQGMHMPRWASRLTLTVTDVRVQRLQDISEEDAKAEGGKFFDPANHLSHGGWSHDEWHVYETAKQSFVGLWGDINGPGSWQANPWVAAYTFTVQRGNIDQLGKGA